MAWAGKTPLFAAGAAPAVRPVPRTGRSRCHREVWGSTIRGLLCQGHTDHQIVEEPSSASLPVASLTESPSIAARQPRSAQSCCAAAPAVTRVEVVVLVVISILLFALLFRMLTGLFRRVNWSQHRTYGSAITVSRLCSLSA